MNHPFLWLSLNIGSTLILAFFSMLEMASVSFNKIKLHYYVAHNNHRAAILLNMLKKPSVLFGTTLVGVNIATFFGSECNRRFFLALNLPTDVAPLIQIFVVIILGEIAPMFAARKYAEHVSLSGIPYLYFASRLFLPFLWLVESFSKGIHLFFPSAEYDEHLYLSQDEIKKIMEEHEDDKLQQPYEEEYQAISTQIFELRDKCAKHVMSSLSGDVLLNGSLSVDEVRENTQSRRNFWIVYQKTSDYVIGIVYLKDLILSPGDKLLRDICQAPWFVGAATPLIQILKKFQRNHEHVAIVINEKGETIGYVAFTNITNDLFIKGIPSSMKPQQLLIDRTFPGSITMGELETELGMQLGEDSSLTLAEWLNHQMEHAPEERETYIYKGLTFIIKETSFLEVKSVRIIAYTTG